MKTKRILALLLALLMLLGSGAAFSASAANGIDDEIAVHKEIWSTGSDYDGYCTFWATGVYPGNTLTWIVKDGDGNDLPGSAYKGYSTSMGYIAGIGMLPGDYRVTVEVAQGTGEEWNTNTPNYCEFTIPDRTNLRNALINDKMLRFAFLYDDERWAAYDYARQRAELAYWRYDLGQAILDECAEGLNVASGNLLPVKEGPLYVFLWNVMNFVLTLSNIFPGVKKNPYTI